MIPGDTGGREALTMLFYNFFSFIKTRYSIPYFKESKFYFYKILLNNSPQSQQENQGILWNSVINLNFMPISDIYYTFHVSDITKLKKDFPSII